MTTSGIDSQWDSVASGFDSQGSVLESSASNSDSQNSNSHHGGFLTEGQHVAVFLLAGTRYALEVKYVGEVISLDHATDVPLTPACILGVRNLRGSALPIVDLAAVLDLATDGAKWSIKEGMTAVVLTLPGSLDVAVPIDQMEAVIPWQNTDLLANEVIAEHSAVRGVLDLTKRGGQMTTLLDGEELTRRLERLKPQTADSALCE